MQRPFEIEMRREIRQIISSHLRATVMDSQIEDLTSDIMGAIKIDDYMHRKEFEEYRAEWNKKYQQQEEFYRDHINQRDEEIEASHAKITELKESITADSTKRVLETKLAVSQSHNKILKKFVKDILEEM